MSMEQLQAEYDALTRKIDNCKDATIRVELKRERNAIGGKMVALRQEAIKEERKKEHPQRVPRVVLGRD